MKEILLLIGISGILFLAFAILLIVSIIKRRRPLWITTGLLFVLFIAVGGWTGFRFVTKSYHSVAKSLKARSGEEIYDALFGTRQTDCVRVLESQDQVIPKIDPAIYLHFKTCPEEMRRILSRHEYTSQKIITTEPNIKVPFNEGINWLNPSKFGDTILVFEYTSSEAQNWQTIWLKTDSTEAFCKDAAD